MASVPTSLQESGQEALRQIEEDNKNINQKFEEKKKENETPPESEFFKGNNYPNSPKIFIKKIIVKNNKILSLEEVNKVIKPFEESSLGLRDMHKVAYLLTVACRQKGFVTFLAILPPQHISNNTIVIEIREGLMGETIVRGNHYFKKSFYQRNITLKRDEKLNYNQLQQDVSLINQSQDLHVKLVLVPGQELHQTDVILNVKDRLPIHAEFSYDNYSSKYIGQNGFTGILKDDNLLGFGDTLTLEYQGTNAALEELNLLSYSLPVTNKTDIGVYAASNKLELNGQFEDLMARGKSRLYGFFINQKFITRQDFKIVLNGGFDYKDVYNFLDRQTTSQDRLRIVKLGFNVDYTDQFYGRNIFNNEIDSAIPGIMGGLRSVDPRASTVGAGGEFEKDLTDFIRLQKLIGGSTLLLKSQVQFSSTVLPAVEQYQLGGPANVRGFIAGEAVGDSGQSVTSELNFPMYGIPRSIRVPFTSSYLYNDVKIAAFYDWGHVALRDPQAGESKSRILDSYGTGLRVNLPYNFYFLLDFAWPVTGNPSDMKHEHTWIQITKSF